MPSNGEMPQRPGGDIPKRANGEGFSRVNGEMPNFSRGEAAQQPNAGADAQVDKPQQEGINPNMSENGGEPSDKRFEMPQNGMNGMGGMNGFEGMRPGQNNSAVESTPMTFKGFLKEYQTPIISVVLLALAFVFVVFYKKKNY